MDVPSDLLVPDNFVRSCSSFGKRRNVHVVGAIRSYCRRLKRQSHNQSSDEEMDIIAPPGALDSWLNELSSRR